MKKIEIIEDSVRKLESWLRDKNYSGYDPFDGLSSVFRPLTLENQYGRVFLQQSVRQFPFNLRRYIGVRHSQSSKGMGYILRGYLFLYKFSGDKNYLKMAQNCLAWLIKNSNRNYSGLCWGNHFDYQSGLFYLPKNEPTVVWTSLIGHSIIDIYEIENRSEYRLLINSICDFIIKDLSLHKDEYGTCISYITNENKQVHNSNLLAASFLSRSYKITGNKELRNLASNCVDYAMGHINKDFSWYYAVEERQHWIDNFHTGYNLDSIKHYIDYTGDKKHIETFQKAYDYYISNFFTEEKIPKYYHNRLYPIDIQCCSQSIETLVKLKDYNVKSLDLAYDVAIWTISNMQDESGFFYFRKYMGFNNKTPTLHWGQATMFSALSALLYEIKNETTSKK